MGGRKTVWDARLEDFWWYGKRESKVCHSYHFSLGANHNLWCVIDYEILCKILWSLDFRFRVQATPSPGVCPMKLVLLRWSSPQESGQVVASCAFTDALSGASLGPLEMHFTNICMYSISPRALISPYVLGSRWALTPMFFVQMLHLVTLARFVIYVEALGDTSVTSSSGYVLLMYADQPLAVDHC